MSKTTVTCPRCGEREFTPYGVKLETGMPPYPSLSRTDNHTYICSECGTTEALKDYLRESLFDQEDWKGPQAA